MVQSHGDESADKAEVGEVVRVDGRGRVDLQAVIVLPSIFKQTVHRVEHLMGQEEKPLSGDAAVVQALLTTHDDVEPAPQVVRFHVHNLLERILKECLPGNADLHMAG